jgi:hypothetical protein
MAAFVDGQQGDPLNRPHGARGAVPLRGRAPPRGCAKACNRSPMTATHRSTGDVLVACTRALRGTSHPTTPPQVW